MPLASLLMLGFTAGVAFFFALPAWLWARCLRRDNAPLGDALAFAALLRFRRVRRRHQLDLRQYP